MNLPIYLDYMSSTPIDHRVRYAMLKYLTDDKFGNASSGHYYGLIAREAIETARIKIARSINAKNAKEVIWVSGATEANNLAIKGAANFYKRKGRHIITSKIEHKSVLETCAHLESQGFRVTYLSPKKNGLIDVDMLSNEICDETILVSIQWVSNEIGVIQDIKAIGDLVKSRGIIFHVDAAQALGKIPIDLQSTSVDLMSFSAHKIYGPKGIGALYIRSEPRIRLDAQIHGSGQEFNIRSGTLATHQIVGMGVAVDLSVREMAVNNEKICRLQNRFLEGICGLNGILINGDVTKRIVHNLSVSFICLNESNIISLLDGVAVSSKSACSSGDVGPSHVLKALGLSDEVALNTVRFSFGNKSCEEEIDFVIEKIRSILH